jgi:hypothetical protein
VLIVLSAAEHPSRSSIDRSRTNRAQFPQRFLPLHALLDLTLYWDFLGLRMGGPVWSAESALHDARRSPAASLRQLLDPKIRREIGLGN